MTAVWRTHSREQDGSKRSNYTAVATQANVGRFAHCYNDWGSEKSPNSGYLLKTEPTELAEGLHVGCEGKWELRAESWVLGLSSWGKHHATYWEEEKWGQSRCGTEIKRCVWTWKLRDTYQASEYLAQEEADSGDVNSGIIRTLIILGPRDWVELLREWV